MKEPDSQRLERTRRLAEAVARVFCVRLKKTARRVGIIFQTGLVLTVLITSLGLQRWATAPAQAGNTTFTESFATTTYKDTTNTTANWFGNGTVTDAPSSTFTYGRWQYPNTGRMSAYDISCASSSVCYIAANGATILKTTDSGSTWVVKHDSARNFGITYGSGAVPGFEAIVAVSSNVVYAAGNISSATSSTRPIVVKTTDGGENWKQVYVSTANQYIEDIDCADANNCFWAGGERSNAGKYLYVTTDGGVSWSKQTLPSGSYDLYGIGYYNDGTSSTIL